MQKIRLHMKVKTMYKLNDEIIQKALNSVSCLFLFSVIATL